jgi:hypothetical protein
MNQIACKDCVHFDPQYKNVQQIGVDRQPYIKKIAISGHGMCAKQSKYPAKEQGGQVFPPDAIRVNEGELAIMVPVSPNGVVTHCIHAVKR